MSLMRDEPVPQVVVETSAYLKRAVKLLTDLEREEVVFLVADNPLVGDLLVGTGGVRKTRFARGDRGKSGGVRVVYFFYDEEIPVYLLTVFAKKDRANLTKDERNQLGKLTAKIVEAHQKRKKS